MTFEITPITGNTFGDYNFQIKHHDDNVVKRVKAEVIKFMRSQGYTLEVRKGPLER